LLLENLMDQGPMTFVCGVREQVLEIGDSGFRNGDSEFGIVDLEFPIGLPEFAIAKPNCQSVISILGFTFPNLVSVIPNMFSMILNSGSLARISIRQNEFRIADPELGIVDSKFLFHATLAELSSSRRRSVECGARGGCAPGCGAGGEGTRPARSRVAAQNTRRPPELGIVSS